MRLLLLLLVSLSFSEEPTTPEPTTPLAIKSTLDTFESEAVKAYSDYLKVTSKSTDKATKDLDAKLKTAMKSNNLELATKIKKQIEELTKGKTLDNLEAKWKELQNTEPLGKNTDPILGKWGNGSAVMWDFKPDGTGLHYWSGAILTFKWTKTDKNYSVTVVDHNPRIAAFIDKNTIQIEPGTSIRMK